MKIKLDAGAKMPTRAYEFDGGLDLYSPVNRYIFGRQQEFVFGSGETAEMIDTGVHVQIPHGYVGLIRTRSSMLEQEVITGGTIDSDYTGSIKVKLINLGTRSYHVKAGDKIAQLVIVPCLIPTLELTDALEETERGDNGFGSSGR